MAPNLNKKQKRKRMEWRKRRRRRRGRRRRETKRNQLDRHRHNNSKEKAKNVGVRHPLPPQMLSGCFPDAFRMLGDAGRCLRLWACPPISAPPAELLHDGLRRVGIPAPSVEECPQKPPYESIRRCHGNLPESISGPSVLVGCASFFFSSPSPPVIM